MEVDVHADADRDVRDGVAELVERAPARRRELLRAREDAVVAVEDHPDLEQEERDDHRGARRADRR